MIVTVTHNSAGHMQQIILEQKRTEQNNAVYRVEHSKSHSLGVSEIVSPSKMKFPSLTGGSPGGRCWYSRSLLDTTESFLMQSWMVFT